MKDFICFEQIFFGVFFTYDFLLSTFMNLLAFAKYILSVLQTAHIYECLSTSAIISKRKALKSEF